MAHENSPSAVMYAELKDLGIKKSDAATLLLDTKRNFGGGLLGDRVESPSQLTRYIVQTAPGEMGRALFQDFGHSSQTIMGRIAAKLRKGGMTSAEAHAAIAERFSGESAEAIQRALDEYGIDSSVYRNALAHVGGLELENETDRTALYVMLFLITGCLGDPAEAAREVERFAANRMGAAFRTTEASWDDEKPDEPRSEKIDEPLLGLMRIVDGRLKGGSLHRLSTQPDGTEIGALAAGNETITDVDPDVSRHHARIYRENGHWYIVGLKSTNGTTIISGGDKLERIVEPPKKDRPRDYQPEPAEILPSDTICLGSSTRFLVMPIAE